ncbi:hypothetical protein AVEN_74269-1 [Araneus ventricosus]|uniref:RNase H type-1 domain-containing protein n=1 Tax=Araneus ventricosus TaxID=182803 RepID=A0A4Y2JJJ5_ARAVE|nr:hypothetical protein AVEN_74269-1 [Araneus ventricosus]
MRSTEAQDILNIENLDKFANISEIRPKNKLIELTETKGDQIYDIYMDGSRIISDTGFTVCILKKKIHQQKNIYSDLAVATVFQTELAAIDFAAAGL